MNWKRTALTLVAFTLLLGRPGSAQTEAAVTVNPEALDFNLPSTAAGDRSYRLELFAPTSNPDSDQPVKSTDVHVDRVDSVIRVSLAPAIVAIPDGEYKAVLRVVDASGPAIQSRPSNVFVLSREESLADRVAIEHRERFWTKVGIAIGAAAMLIPFIF